MYTCKIYLEVPIRSFEWPRDWLSHSTEYELDHASDWTHWAWISRRGVTNITLQLAIECKFASIVCHTDVDNFVASRVCICIRRLCITQMSTILLQVGFVCIRRLCITQISTMASYSSAVVRIRTGEIYVLEFANHRYMLCHTMYTSTVENRYQCDV
jgi:hypothetical protein